VRGDFFEHGRHFRFRILSWRMGVPERLGRLHRVALGPCRTGRVGVATG
jgi:hypothetical protein